MALATAATVTSLFLPSDIVLPFYQASRMPRSLPQLALESLESLEVFTSAVRPLKVKSTGCHGSQGQTPLNLKLAGNDAFTCMNCRHRAVRCLVKSSRAPVGSRFPNERAHTRIAFLAFH
jgi:hypothetical protein